VRPGELIGTTPVLQMADLSRMVVIAHVYETDVKRIHVGQTAVITSRSFESPYDKKGLEGRVTRIGNIIAKPPTRELNPLAPTDRRALDVRIELDAEDGEQAAKYVHMEVDVTFPNADP
jgi:HlyD family secretion protein